MSQDIRFIDKENSLKNLNTKSDNTKRQHISRVPLGAKAGSKQQGPRIPLGGKDENKLIPTLNRSQTNVERSDNVIKKVQLQSKPKFAKSSSSLGFYHNSNTLKPVQTSNKLQIPELSSQSKPDIFKVGPQDKLKHNNNTIFNPELANRPPELEQFSLDTDSLKKKILHIKSPDNVADIKSTITEQTHQLGAMNVPNRRIHNLDPSKRSVENNKIDKYLEDPERAQLFESLVNDENSIETKIPIKKVYDDSEMRFSDEELGISKEQSKNSSSDVHTQLDDINLDETFDMEPKVWAGKEDEQIGLSEEDLNELLDF